MPTRSPGDTPAGKIRDLGLPGRAVNALTRAGITSIEDLAVLSRRDLAAIKGLGPGMITAIRLVVPEPPTSAGPPGAPAETGREATVPPAIGTSPEIHPEPEPAEEESPDAPMIPSFDSLRAPRRRTAVDLLVPEPPPAPGASGGSRPSGGAPGESRPSGGPRPAEYGDLLRLGVRVVRALAAVPGRLAVWSVREPVRCLRGLLGG